MRRKGIQLILGVLIGSGLILAGCETAGGSAGAGALLGGLAGGIIGNQSGHAWEGAAIGAVVGGLAGLIVHDIKTRRVRDAQQTAQDYSYTPDQGFKMDLRKMAVSPGSVKQGGTVTSTVEYATLGAGQSGVNVDESCVLKKDGEVVATLSEKKVTRTDGTWENVLEFEVPSDAAPGQYVIAQDLKAKDLSRSSQMGFNVQTQTATLIIEKPPDIQLSMAAAH